MTHEDVQTPSEQLARRVVTRLVKDKLLTKEEADKLLPRLIDGSVKSEDWRLAVELSIEDKTSDNT